MDTGTLPDLGFDWNEVFDLIQTKGVDLAINVVIALLIFYVGKLVVGLLVRALHKVMQRQEVDKTLETFICNLVRVVLLVVVAIAAISALGIETTSFIAIHVSGLHRRKHDLDRLCCRQGFL